MRDHAIKCLSLPAHGPNPRHRPDTFHDSGLCDACRDKADQMRRDAAADALDVSPLLRKRSHR